MAIFKCKMCGGNLEVNNGITVAECEYCGTKQTVSKTSDEVVTNLFTRANNLRLKCEFDKAEQIYEKILDIDNTECEAHWGIVLCKYGIEYVEDPKSFKRIPTCHRTLFEAVTADADYLAAIENADITQKQLYIQEAQIIDGLQKDILNIVNNEKPFDVFICYKQTDENGNRTPDSALANDIYYQLTQEGFKVFYAAITLEDKLGQEYEPYIFAALNSAKVMLVIGTKPQYFDAVWVRNEWSRYLKLMKSDRSKLLIPCYRDMDAYELPEAFAHLQAQDMGKIGFINDVVRGIEKVIGKGQAVHTTKQTSTVIENANGNASALLKRGFLSLEDGEWQKADNFFEQALNFDAEIAEAYLGKLMVELRVKKQDEFKNLAQPFNASNNYQKVIRFANDELKNTINGYIDFINKRNENEHKDSMYFNACRLIDNSYVWTGDVASVENAMSIFESLDGWKDSKEKILVCQKRIKEINASIENERLEREQRLKLEQIEKQMRAKRNKKITLIAMAVLCVIIAFIILLSTVIIPNSRYNKAIALMDAGKYTEAIQAFEELDDYRESANKITECSNLILDDNYNTAIALLDSENIVEAYEAFVELDGYKDSAEKANSIYDKYKAEKLKNAKVGDYVFFGAYEQDDDTSNGKEEGEWLVLEVKDGKALVISKYALDSNEYHNEAYTDVTWESCSLRKWLNNEFISTAFSENEMAMIPTVAVSADKNPNYSTNPGNTTQDKVFLLSSTEVHKYFDSASARQCKPTDHAVANGVFLDKNGTCNWWLRSPGKDQTRAAFVTRTNGVVYEYGHNACDDVLAVRPALWINLN